VDIRAMFIPEEGQVFVCADLAQIEPRCVAVLMRDEAVLTRMREGQSPYEAYARAYLRWEGGKLKDENPRLYALAKVCVLSLAYGTGAVRFREAAAAQGIELSAQEAQRAVDEYRQANHRIVAQWRSLENRFRAHAGKSDPFEIPLRSGRSLRYFDVCYRAEDQSYVARTEIGGNFQRFWGSKLFENAIQATARDVFMGMMLQAEREGLRTILHVHDELLVECPAEEAEQVRETLTHIMTTPPDWLPDIPLAAESEILNHFA
jgi:DNA polymerase